ncbi:hypothetical protein VNO78_18113 [Psophocarpus tetragonolobus]|uniref:Uncharacterized protein n=1 Tax=Psophocarpus tetragonolobus TaxID=3891 RepID=A0AAN9SIR5_PSOTE
MLAKKDSNNQSQVSVSVAFKPQFTAFVSPISFPFSSVSSSPVGDLCRYCIRFYIFERVLGLRATEFRNATWRQAGLSRVKGDMAWCGEMGISIAIHEIPWFHLITTFTRNPHTKYPYKILLRSIPWPYSFCVSQTENTKTKAVLFFPGPFITN